MFPGHLPDSPTAMETDGPEVKPKPLILTATDNPSQARLPTVPE
jgi:hypothetical protein